MKKLMLALVALAIVAPQAQAEPQEFVLCVRSAAADKIYAPGTDALVFAKQHCAGEAVDFFRSCINHMKSDIGMTAKGAEDKCTYIVSVVTRKIMMHQDLESFVKKMDAEEHASATAEFNAETYNYSCSVEGRAYPLWVDATKNVLEWMGKKYSLTEQPDCGRWGWHAEGDGPSFDFCTATKGYASIKYKDKDEVQCNQKR